MIFVHLEFVWYFWRSRSVLSIFPALFLTSKEDPPCHCGCPPLCCRAASCGGGCVHALRVPATCREVGMQSRLRNVASLWWKPLWGPLVEGNWMECVSGMLGYLRIFTGVWGHGNIGIWHIYGRYTVTSHNTFP